jgi:hypothetical protein
MAVVAAKADDVFIINQHFHLLWTASDAACAVAVLLFSFAKCLS